MRHRSDGGWQQTEKRGNPYGLASGGPQTITEDSQLEHIDPQFRDFEKVTVQFKNGRKILTDTAEIDRGYLRQRGMWDGEDDAWFEQELAKLGNEEFITDHKVIEYFSGVSGRISARALLKQVQKLGKDTEVYIIGGNALDDTGWEHYKDAVSVLDGISVKATGSHAAILTPPSMKTEKDYDYSKSYLFDPEARQVYAFGFSRVAKESGPDILPFGVPAEWTSEIYGPYFERFKRDVR